MSAASKGRSAEWVVRDVLRKLNYIVFRARASKGAADLLAFNSWEVLLVAVRKERWPSPRDRKRLLAATIAPFIRVLAARTRRGKVEFAIDRDGKLVRVRGPLPIDSTPAALDLLRDSPAGVENPNACDESSLVAWGAHLLSTPDGGREKSGVRESNRKAEAEASKPTEPSRANLPITAAANPDIRKYGVPHDCLTREHDPDEWCPDCFPLNAR